MLNDKKYRAILCLNGELPDKAFFARNLPIIAADGAANKLAAMNLKPDMIIGDMDCVDAALLAATPHQLDPDQMTTDFQKSLRYMQRNDLLPAIIVGVSGGHLDHILNNVNLFLQTDCLLYAPPLIGVTLTSGANHTLPLTAGTKISLFGIPHAIVTTHGLKWDMDAHAMTFPGVNSCLNRVSADSVQINVHEGNVLVLIYQHPVIDAGVN